MLLLLLGRCVQLWSSPLLNVYQTRTRSRAASGAGYADRGYKFRDLARSCLEKDPWLRPNMDTTIEQPSPARTGRLAWN